jgi:hypothetical protein
MEQWVKCISILALCCIFFLVACGGDDDKAPTGPKEDMGAQLSPEAVALTGVLVQSFQSALFASLVADTDTTAIAGVEGTLQIRGNTWEMVGYSPDGSLFLDGTLDVGKELFPNIPVKGTINISGAQEGTMVIDMVLAMQGTELGAAGTLTIDDEVFNIADLIAARTAAGG